MFAKYYDKSAGRGIFPLLLFYFAQKEKYYSDSVDIVPIIGYPIEGEQSMLSLGLHGFI